MPGDPRCSQKNAGDLFRVDLDHKLKVEFIFYDITIHNRNIGMGNRLLGYT